MPVNLNMSGEGIEFNREVSESTALRIMELSMNEESASREDGGFVDGEPEALPRNFFNRLSSKQRALIKVLLEVDGQLTSTELRQRMSSEYGVETGGGRALAGILAGFTRKYGEDFDLVEVNWGDGEGLYRLNPDRPEYIEELEEHFDE